MGIDKLQIPSFYDNLILTDEDLMNTAEVLKRCTGFAETKGVLLGSESVMVQLESKYPMMDDYKTVIKKDMEILKSIFTV